MTHHDLHALDLEVAEQRRRMLGVLAAQGEGMTLSCQAAVLSTLVLMQRAEDRRRDALLDLLNAAEVRA